ncbi:polyribonucleotide nucleotidyltransferase [Candidatus Gracilibacteria bacterium]|nr:polyribonucleotide nucleotidyltransferase [Candidatus Gracilibacteria bacterium]
MGLSDKNAINIVPLKKTYSIGGQNITFETKKFGFLANGSVTISDDKGNIILTNVGIKDEQVNENADFFPLVVDYVEKYYATGKIGGNRFSKREGKPSELATLTSRLIDRPIRPMFPKGFINDTQIIVSPLSLTGEQDLGYFGILGASLGLLMTNVPFEGPVSGVKIIYIDGKYIFNPSIEEEKQSSMVLLVAGTLDAITMVESESKEVSKDIMMKGLEFAFNIIKELCNAQIDFINEYKKIFEISEVKHFFNLVNEEYYEKIENFLTNEKLESLYGLGKKDFHKILIKIEEEVKEFLGVNDENLEELGLKSNTISELVYKRVKKVMRENVLKHEKRLDLRKLDEVRPLKSETGILPRAHGSGLFQRGMTQILSVVTLGGPEDIQLIDDMYEETSSRYIHHYNFPPYSVGEVRMLRGVGRREIGHGKLAEKALQSVLPSEEKFPYMIRVVSETMTCNGSSSMASVCGSTLALMQAGVPISAPVGGIAMGMIYDEKTGNYKILSDIQAQEDFLGDMDFKVTMSPNGITAMQLDVKIKGLSLEVFDKAFTQAKVGIDQILDSMLEAQPKVEEKLSPYAPLIMSILIPLDKIKGFIGKGGENIQRVEKDYNVKISIADDGHTTITAKNNIGGEKAINEIKEFIWEVEVGYNGVGEVVKIIDGTGAIVEFRGKSGMIHISKLSPLRVEKVEDILKVGDKVEFEVIEVNKEKGRVGLKRKPSKEEVEKYEALKKEKEAKTIENLKDKKENI